MKKKTIPAKQLPDMPALARAVMKQKHIRPSDLAHKTDTNPSTITTHQKANTGV